MWMWPKLTITNCPNVWKDPNLLEVFPGNYGIFCIIWLTALRLSALLVPRLITRQTIYGNPYSDASCWLKNKRLILLEVSGKSVDDYMYLQNMGEVGIRAWQKFIAPLPINLQSFNCNCYPEKSTTAINCYQLQFFPCLYTKRVLQKLLFQFDILAS